MAETSEIGFGRSLVKIKINYSDAMFNVLTFVYIFLSVIFMC